MENEQINKWIHTELMGKCWHTPVLQQCHQAPNTGPELCNEKHWYCEKCGIETSGDPGGNGGSSGPDYCSDTSPRSLLNEAVAKVIHEVGSDAYVEALQAVSANEMLSKMPWKINDEALSLLATCPPTEAVTATAKQIALAIYNVGQSAQTAMTTETSRNNV